MVEKEGISQT